MAYIKGSLAINHLRDIPLLRHIRYSTVISHSQLFQFMTLGHHETRRSIFNWRLRRLVDHGLVNRHCVSPISRDYLYTIASSGIACLERHGDFYLSVSALPQSELQALHLLHYLELNEIHLAFLRSQVLSNWIPESRLLSLINLGASPYVKAYDAVVEVILQEQQFRFALEYEHNQKSMKRYLEIREAIEAEQNISLVLYLMPSSSLMAKVAQYLSGCKRPIYCGLVDEFKEALLDTRVSNDGRIHLRTLRDALVQP